MLANVRLRHFSSALAALLLSTAALTAEPLPGRLQGAWRITRILPTSNTACWSTEQAQLLVGSTLMYREEALRWRDGAVPLYDVTTRTVTADDFSKENGAAEKRASFSQLGIHARSVLEVDLQHEDMDITGATTEVPGDTVLLAGPNRIIIQACGVFFEASRNASVTHASLRR